MRVDLFDFELPQDRIALRPARPRDSARLLLVEGRDISDHQVLEIALGLRPSARGALEITDVHRAYLARGQLHVEPLGRGTAWLDTGTPESRLQAANYIQAIEERQGLMVACVEEIAYRMKYIAAGDLRAIAQRMAASPYGQYLLRCLDHQPGEP